MPALVAFGIFSVVCALERLFLAAARHQQSRLAPPPLGVGLLRNEEAGTDYGPLMAGAAIITAPLVIAFLLAQRRFIEGMTITGLKG